MPTRLITISTAIALAVTALTTACSQASSTTNPPSTTASTWVDQPVTFQAGGLTIYATYRHPSAQATNGANAARLPAVLLIAGSGPTDRNGNSPLLPGTIGTLQTLADWLSADGVASLRYDKLGSGSTGLGPYAQHPGSISIAPFEQEAAAALRFLARQPGVDPARLGVIGHSEGALFALLLATNADPKVTGPVPPVRALGLLEPLAVRYLDAVAPQFHSQSATLNRALAIAITQLRATGTVPAGLPPPLSGVFSPVNARFLYQADRYDPAALAARLSPGTPVLVTCSNADLQVSCAEVSHLRAGLARPPAKTDFVLLTGVDHVLKQDPTGSGANYTSPLPFSPQLQQALRTFVRQNL